MSNEEIVELAESTLEPLDQVAQLITQGKINEARERIEGRKKKEGIEEIRWGIIESELRNNMGEFDQVIKLTEKITKEIEEIEEFLDQKGEKERIKIDILNEHVWALQNMGRLDEGLEKVEEGIKLLKELDVEGQNVKDKERKTKLLLNKGNIYLYKGEMEQSWVYYEKSLLINEELGNKELISLSLNNMGNIYHWKGELDQAMEYYKISLKLREETGNKQSIAGSQNNIGLIYQKKGKLDKALKYYDKCLVICQEMGYKRLIAHPLTNIGQVYHLKGNLDKALEYYDKGRAIFKKQGDKNQTAELLLHIGCIYHESGELAAASYFLHQCMEICEEIGSNLFLAYPLFYLISVALDFDNIKQARDHLTYLQQINEQEENKQVDLFSRLGEALVLKKSKRRKNLSRAEEILEEIIEEGEEEIIEHRLTVLALVNLSELLLEELRSTGEEEILEEVEEKVDMLVEFAKKQQSYSLLTESYLLKAQLSLVRLDLKESRNFLSQAQVIAEEKGLDRLASKISSEHDQLLEQFKQWEELIAKDASISERVKVANLEELMGWMARKREIKIDKKEDEPVMILLVSESGLPIYCKQFGQTKELQDMLISGFLSSINTFVKEAFDAPGMIRRIMHDDYTLSFDLIEPILFCYVYEGPSYTAMKKLDKLIIQVFESEVWPALEEVGKKGYKLKNGEIAQMEGVIEEIFLTN